MIRTRQDNRNEAKAGYWLIRALNFLGSLKVGIVLLALLAAVVAAATVVEAQQGRISAQWYVYQSSWFVALLALLGVNIFFAAVAHWPWQRQQIGFLLTHGGLLVLLGGSILTFTHGVEGQVTLTEGESTALMTIPHLNQLTAFWVDRPGEAPFEFPFQPGPVSWREGKTLSLGAIDGVGARVLHYYRHAKAMEEWVADPRGEGGPLVKIAIQGNDGNPAVEHLLVDQDYEAETVDPICVRLQRATTDVMLEDFLKPPTANLGNKGLLLAYFGGGVWRIPVDGNLGKKIALDDHGVAVEIVDYFPNASPDALGRFRSLNDKPQNPLLQLKVYHSDHKEPLRQLASGRHPLLNLDLVYDQTCPVKFVYYHPSVDPASAVELLQTGDGKLYGRLLADQKYVSLGQVQVGQPLRLPGNSQVSIAEHLPHAQLNLSFEPIEMGSNQKGQPEPAVEIEVSVAGTRHTVWLQENNNLYGSQTIATPQGPLELKIGPGERDLGFSLKLVQFRRGTNPGGIGNATYESVVRLVDPQQNLDQERKISMNEPLTHNHLTFYQAGFGEGGHGRVSSTLMVAHDPGGPLKYAGCLLVCFGIATMFIMRTYFFKQVPRLLRRRPSTARAPSSSDAGLEPATCEI